MYLQNFEVIRPDFESAQAQSLEWIISAHTHARMQLNGWKQESREVKEFRNTLKSTLFKLGLGEERIKKRGSHIPDFFHDHWEEMEIYNLALQPEGFSLDKRMAFFSKASTKILEKIYPTCASLPSHLIHVTCTGYVSPSPAQRLVSLRAGKETMVTHAYHMGCYGAIPGIRMAMGHFALEKKKTDIVHTEFCTLHLNPTLHTIEQLLVQSLFADGFIKYTLDEKKGKGSFLKIHSILEEIIANTTSKMTWECHPSAFQMTLSKDIPVLLRKNIRNYLEKLTIKSKNIWKKARFAIHPGGPKIIDQIADHLHLEEKQIRHCKEVLKQYGNMSSATLPHVWDMMLSDPSVEEGEMIISLAFGPGLCIAGGLFEKQGN